MTALVLAAELALDVERIAAHLTEYEVADIEGRVAEIFDALELLLRHPLIGRPVAGERRELVMGEGARGYVARYAYDRLADAVVVLALQAQREVGFQDR